MPLIMRPKVAYAGRKFHVISDTLSVGFAVVHTGTAHGHGHGVVWKWGVESEIRARDGGRRSGSGGGGLRAGR